MFCLSIHLVIVQYFILSLYPMYTRKIYSAIIDNLFQGKGIIIYGARQVGKTTLCKSLLSHYPQSYYLTGDDPYTVQLLSDKSIHEYVSLFQWYNLLCIDEAQNITNIWSILKLLIDNIPDLQVIATGSSSFDLANKINEPLTGRVHIYHLYPLSVQELVSHDGALHVDQHLTQRLIYGMYPEALLHHTEKTLIWLAESYVYKDIFALDMIKKSDSIVKLLQAIAYQIGNQVSYNELSQIVGLDPKTIQKYIHILEQAFIIFRLPSFARNLRNELKTTQKIYFWDTGIRNSIIRRFAPIDMRDDVGALWENFIIAEILKSDHNDERFSLSYFWRTNTQLEIDLVQDHNGELSAYEIKRNPKKSKPLPKIFMETYMPKVSHTITRDNWLGIVGKGV